MKRMILLLTICVTIMGINALDYDSISQRIEDQEAKEVLEELRNYEKENSDLNSEFYYWLGKSYFAVINNQQVGKLKSIGYFKKGKKALGKAIELDKTNTDAMSELAEPLYYIPGIAGGDKKKALELVEMIKAIDPNKGIKLEITFMKEESEEEALKACKKYLAEHPEDTDILYEQGIIYQNLKVFDKAFESFETAVSVDEDALASLYQIGRTAVFSGMKMEKGIESMKLYLTKTPDDGLPGLDSAHWRLGMLYEMQDQTELAKSEYQKAIELNPDESSYKNALNKLKG